MGETLNLRPPLAPRVQPAAAGAARAPTPACYPAWCSPHRLRRQQLRRGWRCQPTRAGRWAKRGLDLGLCLLLGGPALLLIALAALAVWLESVARGQAASPFLRQARLGQHGRVFAMCKLRTMVRNAAALESSVAHLNELPWPDFKISRDPRVTPIGAWLRRSSLDELPQIWNIVRGEMSWVGPRPTNFGLEEYQLWHAERLAMPPGLTGLWQILERAQCDFDRRLRLDLAYIRSWRPSLDLAILAATLGVVIRGRGAY